MVNTLQRQSWALDDLPDEIPNDLSIVVNKLKEIYG